MTQKVLTVGALKTNCYLVWDDARRAVVIDPGDEAARLLDEIQAERLKVEAVLLTHLHIDHFMAVPRLVEVLHAPLWMPRTEQPALTDGERSLMNWLPPEQRFALCPDRLLDEGDTLTVGALTLTVLHTPGHTAGSCCYRCGKWLFSGDTLFAGTAGRTDLVSGSERQLRESFKRLAAIPDNLRVFPGHGFETDLARERQTNPYMK